jgi:hypothetical protein
MTKATSLSMELNEVQRETIFRATQEYRQRHVNDNPRYAISSSSEIKALLAALRDKAPLTEQIAITATGFLTATADETETLAQARYYMDLAELIDKKMSKLYDEAQKLPSGD